MHKHTHASIFYCVIAQYNYNNTQIAVSRCCYLVGFGFGCAFLLLLKGFQPCATVSQFVLRKWAACSAVRNHICHIVCEQSGMCSCKRTLSYKRAHLAQSKERIKHTNSQTRSQRKCAVAYCCWERNQSAQMKRARSRSHSPTQRCNERARASSFQCT